ncbi:MAG TPA: signal peptidase I [Verrucomicrobiae bacterium]
MGLLKFCCVAGFCFCSYFLCSHFVIGTIKVVGKSMQPGLHDSDCCLLNRWILYVRAPNRSEVVVLRDPGCPGLSVKRVIGRPGDFVYLRDGAVYVNGAKLNEPYLSAGTKTLMAGSGSGCLFRCGVNEYFVLGDNRSDSADSREYGPVSEDRLLGLVVN